MGMSDYQAGYQAYFEDQPLDQTRSAAWQNGWLDAQDDDFDAYDDYYYEGDWA